jgi:hypothetical protein
LAAEIAFQIGATVGDVIVGQDVAAGADDEAGAAPALGCLRRLTGAFPAGGAAGLAAATLEKSLAAPKPSALILLTQAASEASRGPVEVRLNCTVERPACATIRLDFWKVRATLGGKAAVTMMSELAEANSLGRRR